MDIATGIDYSAATPIARCIGASGQETSLRIDELGRSGLPRTTGTFRRIKTDLRSWKPCSFDEYAYAIGRPVANDWQHAIWSFVDGNGRFLVPALALLRGLAKPNKRLLPFIFRPQSLDDICVLNSNASGPSVSVLDALPKLHKRNYDNLEQRLLWLTCYPSARRAWASVYHSATQGRIDISLPSALIEARVQFVKHGNNHYVTKLGLSSAEALEQPFPFAQGAPSRFTFFSDRIRDTTSLRNTPGRSKKLTLSMNIPRHPSGMLEVSDEEWSLIDGILARPNWMAQNQRDSLDAILGKLANSIPWADVKRQGSDAQAHVAVMFQRWKKSGKWDKILAVLERRRTPM